MKTCKFCGCYLPDRFATCVACHKYNNVDDTTVNHCAHEPELDTFSYTIAKMKHYDEIKRQQADWVKTHIEDDVLWRLSHIEPLILMQ